MKAICEIKPLKDRPSITVSYVNKYFDRTENTGVCYYDKYKISVLLSSGIAAVVNDSVIPTVAGDVLFFRPDEIHFGRILKSGCQRYIDIMVPTDYFDGFSFSCEDINRFLRHTDKKINHISLPQNQRETILSLALSLAEGCHKSATHSDYLTVLNILDLCSKAYAEQQADEGIHMPDTVSKALGYITDNFSKKLTLKEIAKASSCSVTYLSKIFKEHVGCTPYEHLLYLRMINAQRLLKSGKSVTDTCFESGYFDCSHFIKAFKKHTGLTPKEYIKAYLKDK